MTFAVFQEQMDRVAGLRYRPVSLQTHWEALRDMDEDDLARAVTWGQRNWPDFPSPLEVREAAERSEPRVEGRDEVRHEPCEACGDTGWHQTANPGQPTVERCVCWFTNPVLLRRRERASQQAAQRQARNKATA